MKKTSSQTLTSSGWYKPFAVFSVGLGRQKITREFATKKEAERFLKTLPKDWLSCLLIT